ncbi:MAG TPA: ABC transporter permease [Ktedonobacterales bacterium]|jgi:ABC-2 type transport system permease protein|nr:ABC transporter permease [Ktedonobacterales bacterium]
MSNAVAITPSAPAATRLHSARPSFVGIVRGEVFKVSRQISTWVLAVLYLGAICLPYLVLLGSGRIKTEVRDDPMSALYSVLGVDMVILKVFGGALIIIVTARLIGMEYSGGTIRVLLSRGVGRLQLLFGKLTALALIALGIVAVTLLLDLLLTVVLLLATVGNLDLFKSATSVFWSDAGTYLLLALLSLGVTILMATAVTVVGRSLAFGVAVSLLWYPAENISVLFLFLGFRLTNSNFWTLLSGDFLGLNLNAMAAAILPPRAALAASINFQTPLVPVDGGHTLLVTALWAIVFAVVAIVLTARRDVKE